MSTRLVIHIGLRKTGSSALQELLSKNGALLSEHGLEYPARLSRFPAHQELAWSLEAPRPYHDAAYEADEVYGHFRELAEANAAQGISTVLSSEDLSLLTFRQDLLTEIRTRFQGLNPEIVYFYRDPVSYHISNYKHAIFQERETRTFAEYVFRVFSLGYADREFMQRAWKSAFGDDQVTVLPYASQSFAKESILSQFLSAVFGTKIEDTFRDYRSNGSMPDSAIPYIRELNASDYSDESLRALKRQIRAQALPSSQEEFLKQNLTPDELGVLRRLYPQSA